MDRLPPHSQEAEQGVLGCILLDPPKALGEAVEKFAGRKVFYDLRHQTIYDELVSLWDAQKPIDAVTFGQHLKDAGNLEAVGGHAYLSSLIDAVPSAANLPYYVSMVLERYLLREMLRALVDGEGKIYEHHGEVNETLDTIEGDVLRVNQGRLRAEAKPIKELVIQCIDRIEDIHRGKAMLGGLGTQFGYLDKMTGGFHRQEVIVLAARPSMGKTSLAMNLANHFAVTCKLGVGVFSMEMSADDIVLRLICARARVDFHKIRTGFLTKSDFPAITGAAGAVASSPLFIDDTPALSILELRAKARRMVHRQDVKIFFVDYLQLMNSTNRRAHDRQQEIADISGGLKGMAKELNVPVVVLSQLNRELDKEKNRKPRLSDLRESGAIEQDADLVGMLYQPRSKDDDDDEECEYQRRNLLIAKQRNGPTGDVELIFRKSSMLFEDAYGNRGKQGPPAATKATQEEMEGVE